MYVHVCYPRTGIEADGVRKPVPGKALLPVLDSPSPTSPPSPTPPTSLPPAHPHTRNTRMLLATFMYAVIFSPRLVCFCKYSCCLSDMHNCTVLISLPNYTCIYMCPFPLLTPTNCLNKRDVPLI